MLLYSRAKKRNKHKREEVNKESEGIETVRKEDKEEDVLTELDDTGIDQLLEFSIDHGILEMLLYGLGVILHVL